VGNLATLPLNLRTHALDFGANGVSLNPSDEKGCS
jgi:hypothetical protein